MAKLHLNFQICYDTLWAPTARGHPLNVTLPTSHGNCRRKGDSSTVANTRSGSKWRTLLERSSRLAGSCHRWTVQRIESFFIQKVKVKFYFSFKICSKSFYFVKLNHNLTSPSSLKIKICCPMAVWNPRTYYIGIR